MVIFKHLWECEWMWKNISLPPVFIFINDGAEGRPNWNLIIYRIHHFS